MIIDTLYNHGENCSKAFPVLFPYFLTYHLYRFLKAIPMSLFYIVDYFRVNHDLNISFTGW